MAQTAFVAALAAEFTFGNYDTPSLVGPGTSEWVIVATWGGKVDYVTLSRTEMPVLDQGVAPPGLQPRTTYLGILLSRESDGETEFSEYLLMRHRPDDVPVGGVFHPSDGFIRVVRGGGSCRMTGHGRFAHSYGVYQGQPIVRDVPDPAPGATVATAWHLTAESRPWIGASSADEGLRTASVRTSIATPRKKPTHSTPLVPDPSGPHTPRRKRTEELHATNAFA